MKDVDVDTVAASHDLPRSRLKLAAAEMLFATLAALRQPHLSLTKLAEVRESDRN